MEQYKRTHTCGQLRPDHTDTPADEAHLRVRDGAAAVDDRVWAERRRRGLAWGIDNTLIGRDHLGVEDGDRVTLEPR